MHHRPSPGTRLSLGALGQRGTLLAHDLYSGEIAYADHCLGTILKVLEDIFTEDFRKEHPLKTASPTEVDKDSIMDFSDEEARKLEERLKNLGYME